MEIIDGYSHCGLSKYEPIERVRAVMAAAGVERAVLVQHLGEFDNSYLGGIAAADPEHFAAVCLVDHEQANCRDTLRRWSESCQFKGVRFTIDVFSTQPDLAAAAVELGLIIVFFAPQGIAGAVGPLTRFLERHPQALLVISHLGNPIPGHVYNAQVTGPPDQLVFDNLQIAAPSLAAIHDVLRLAEYPNVYLQISGMKMFCPWPHESLYPLIEQAFGRFGAERLYWGSNFPVVGGQSAYIDDLALVLEGKLPLPTAAISAIAGENAKGLWFPEGDRGIRLR